MFSNHLWLITFQPGKKAIMSRIEYNSLGFTGGKKSTATIV
jgi:hypothetical protein